MEKHLTKNDAYALVSVLRSTSLVGPLTDDYLFELRDELNRWIDLVDEAIEKDWNERARSQKGR